MEIDDFIKELDKNLIVNKIEKENGMLLFHCSIKQVLTKCKYCNEESSSIHRRYMLRSTLFHPPKRKLKSPDFSQNIHKTAD